MTTTHKITGIVFVLLLALNGVHELYLDITQAVDVFDVNQVWRAWNWILTIFQVVMIAATIYAFTDLTSGRRFVFVERQQEDEVVEVWKEGEDGWREKTKAMKSELPSEAEVMAELNSFKGRGSVAFWAAKEKQPEVRHYKNARMFCLTQRGMAADKEKSAQERSDRAAETIELSV